MNVDDETAKAIGTGVAQTAAVGILGWIWLWFSKITGLPRRVNRLESRAEASGRLLLALADINLARSPQGKAEAREALRQARGEMYNSMTKIPDGKS